MTELNFKIFWILALLESVFLWPYAVASPLTDGLHHLEARACKVPKNSITNPGFESDFSSWTYHPTYNNGKATATVVNQGQNSQHSIELYGLSEIDLFDPGSAGTLRQRFSVCKNVTFSISWSVYEPQNEVTYDTNHPGSWPSMSMDLYAPNGFNYGIADYYFYPTSFDSMVYSPGSHWISHPAGTWTTYTASFPFAAVGDWMIQIETFAFAESDSSVPTRLKVRLDNFVVKPQ